MSSLLDASEITHEQDVVWLEDPGKLHYVRQAIDKTPRRHNKPRYARDGRMIGYAVLDDQAEPDPDSGLYRRRVFFLLPHDRDSQPNGPYAVGAPGEAVDPSTIHPKNPGAKTDRSQGRTTAIASTAP
ncbi:DUF6009 family protein [Streptomyces sp. NPDC001480]|uniref:DUF6009 family protein n=1 Tax=Streptomyces sp. NPDC001480 TaxID=3364577 RepID=UPI0036AF35FB